MSKVTVPFEHVLAIAALREPTELSVLLMTVEVFAQALTTSCVSVLLGSVSKFASPE
jgi:hypothetical protein